ncbi:nucleosome assembly protein 1;2 [Ipomoea triloba]|uniref:nucleosome assembly protein 1;2 n=1 Tax=Ipomoea triloba TaxID=35885 RepID=UPI00125D184A|nr:nucleosome assembly protein 1;2 [Ipomoea triloba]
MSYKKNTESADEVEELLRAAEDETLLRLSINSHTARGSSAQFIDADLDRRFQALKSRPKTSAVPNKPQKKPAPTASSRPDDVQGPKKVADGDLDGADDLFARFTALKSSLPSYSSSSGSVNDPGRAKLESGEEEDEDDEVEKLMKWAIDAARLDPSPPSDTDDDDVHDDSDEEEDEDSDGAKRKTKRK